MSDGKSETTDRDLIERLRNQFEMLMRLSLEGPHYEGGRIVSFSRVVRYHSAAAIDACNRHLGVLTDG